MDLKLKKTGAADAAAAKTPPPAEAGATTAPATPAAAGPGAGAKAAAAVAAMTAAVTPWVDARWPWRLCALHGCFFLTFALSCVLKAKPAQLQNDLTQILALQLCLLLLALLNCLLLKGRARLLFATIHVLVTPVLVPYGWSLLVPDFRWAVLAATIYSGGCVLVCPFLTGGIALLSGLLFGIMLKHSHPQHDEIIPFSFYVQLASAYLATGLVAVIWRWLLVRLHLLMAANVVTTVAPPAAPAGDSDEVERLRAELASATEERQSLRVAVALHVATVNSDLGFVRNDPKGGKSS